jgi:YD repeat-containing protein
VRFPAVGQYILRLTASDGEFAVSDVVTVDVGEPFIPDPVVDAGPDHSTLGSAVTLLQGSVSVGGAPPPPRIDIAWVKMSGPGAVTFADFRSPVTTARFVEPGTYELWLFAYDPFTENSVHDSVTITVTLADAEFTVDAGPDQSVLLADGAFPQASVSFREQPEAGAPVLLWSKISGPGDMTVTPADGLRPRVTFTAPGTYVLELAATLGSASAFDRLTVTVGPVCVPAPEGLAGWWAGEGDATDALGRNPGVLLGGATFAPGKVGSAFVFDGLDDAVRIPASGTTDLGGGNSFTVECWVMANDFSSPRPIFSWGTSAAGVHLFTSVHSPGKLFANIRGIDGTDQILTTFFGMAAGQYYHVALTFNRLTSRARIYVDGVEYAFNYFFSDVRPNTLGDLRIGGRGPGEHWLGVIDEFSIYHRELSVSEIAAIYQAGAPRCAPVTGGPENIAPSVSAGADRVVALGQPMRLAGQADDDGLPLGSALSTYWTVVSGPAFVGKVLFADATDPQTDVTFPAGNATYVLRLNATDGESLRTDDVTFFVAPTPPPDPTPTLTPITDWRQQWRYKVYPLNGVPGNVAAPDFDSSDYQPGTAAFASGGSCPLQATRGTDWPVNTDIVIRRSFTVPEGVTHVSVQGSVDNFVRVWVNGTDISGGLITATPCNAVGTRNFEFPISLLNLQSGENQIVVLGRDVGVESILDVRIVGEVLLADAGVDQQVAAGQTVTLDASGSFDLFGGGLTYHWRQTSGPAVLLDLADPAHPVFRAPAFANPVRLHFSLWVESARGISTPDEVVVDVAAAILDPANAAPVVDAGVDRGSPTFGGLVLEGVATDDGLPAGSTLTTRWSVVYGSGPVTFAQPDSPVTGVHFGSHGEFRLRLTATDGQLVSSDDVVIFIRIDAGENGPPTVNAGPDRTAIAGDPIVLNGTAADDGQPLAATTLTWRQRTGPGDATFGSPHAAATGVVFSAPGTYFLTLTADDSLLSATDEVVVTVAAAANRAPSVDLGPDRTVPFGQSVVLTPQIDDDRLPTGFTQLSYEQSAGSRPLRVVPDSLGGYTIDLPAIGSYALRLTAHDGELGATDEVAFTVTPAPTAAPLVALTAPASGASFQAGQPIELQASASDSDAGGGILSIAFYDGATLLGTIEGWQSTFSWTGALAGTHDLTAVATDASGTTAASAPIVVNVTPAMPTVALTYPAPYSAFAPGESVTLQANASPSVTGAAIARIEFLVDGAVLAVDPSAPFSAAWAVPAALGDHTLSARATHTAGQTVTSSTVLVRVVGDPTAPNVAELDPAQDGATITAPTPLLGSVAGPTFASWRVEHRRVGSTCGDWVQLASGTEGVPPGGALATFDPTKLLNGIYDVRLVARDAFCGIVATSEQRVVVEGDMKVGHFTVAFSDLSVSLAGLPLTVTRIYDSRELCPGDFGYGWKLDVDSLRLEKSHALGDAWAIEATVGTFSSPSYYTLRDDGPHQLTVRMPDGEVLRFTPKLLMDRPYSRLASVLDADGDDAGQVWLPIQYDQRLKLSYRPRGGTKGATLVALGYRAVDEWNGGGATTIAGNAPLHVSENFDGPIRLATHENSAQDAPLITDATGWELTAKDGRKFRFDAEGRLEQMRDPQGNVLAIVRAGAGRIERVTHSSGKEIVFVRNEWGFITEVIDPAGNRCHYTYDVWGDLRTYHDREATPFTEAPTQSFTYADGTQNLTDLFDGKGVRATRNYYDAEGRIQRTVDADGKETLFTHNVAGRTETIRDSAGNTTTHRYDERGNIVETTTPDGTRTTTAYHTYSDGRKSDLKTSESITGLFTQPDGTLAPKTLTSTYRCEDQDPGTPPANDGLLRELIDPQGHVTSFTYDSRGNALTITDALNRTTTNTYYPDSTLLQSTTDAAGNVTSFTYDAKGLLDKETRTVTVVDATGASVVQTLVTDHDYDANGYLTRMVDATGHATTYENDAHGNRLFERTTRSTDALVRSIVTEHAYDANDRLVKTWDAEHPRVTNPDPTSETVYDENGKPSVTYDALRRLTQMTYTARGELQSTTHADGTTESVTYDAEGRREYVTDRRGKVTQTIYDAQGRVSETWFRGSGTDIPVRLSATTYDAAGRVHTSTDANNHTTTNVYDDSGRRVGMIDALGQSSSYQYDANGNLRYFTDAKGRTTEHQYDLLNRRVATIHPAADLDVNGDGIIGTGESNVITTTLTTYDELGRRVHETDANARTKRFVHDQLGRLTHVVDSANQVTAYTYDELGNQLTQTDANNHTTSYRYDDLGCRTRRTLPLGQVETVLYNAVGNVSQRTDFNGKQTTYGYDALNRLLTRTGNHANAAASNVAFTYTPSGQRETMTDASGVTTYSYDPRDRLRGRLKSK